MEILQDALHRAEQIRCHPLYQQEYARLQRMEQGRQFCRHTMVHFLDVARVCWIQALERQLPLQKDVVYAMGLLHDIGKGLQYEFGTPHQEAGAQLAEQILPDCSYTQAEIDAILQAIRQHRTPGQTTPLAEILYTADKKTRLCFCCPASADCNWPPEKKNQQLIY